MPCAKRVQGMGAAAAVCSWGTDWYSLVANHNTSLLQRASGWYSFWSGYRKGCWLLRRISFLGTSEDSEGWPEPTISRLFGHTSTCRTWRWRVPAWNATQGSLLGDTMEMNVQPYDWDGLRQFPSLGRIESRVAASYTAQLSSPAIHAREAAYRYFRVQTIIIN